jgi:holo-[acyl-carrier protein] synthase
MSNWRHPYRLPKIVRQGRGFCCQGFPDEGGSEMAIVGVGVDIAEVNRIRHLMERYGERFLRRVFCDEELAYCQQFADPLPHLAARWAAKEAVAKALATGFTQGVTWKSICVVNHFWGEPAALLRDGALRRAQVMGVRCLWLSLSHTRDLAVAVAVLEG